MQAFIEIFRLTRAKNIIFVHNACLNKGYSAAFESPFGYFERYIADCTYLWTQRLEAGFFDRPQRQQALCICRIFPFGIVDAYFIYELRIDITLFLNVNSDWETAHSADCIVTGMAERYIASITKRLPVAVASYSDFVLISTQKSAAARLAARFAASERFLSSSKRILETRSRFCGQRKFISRSYCSLVSSFIFIKSVSAITLRVSSDRLQYPRTVS